MNYIKSTGSYSVIHRETEPILTRTCMYTCTQRLNSSFSVLCSRSRRRGLGSWLQRLGLGPVFFETASLEGVYLKMPILVSILRCRSTKRIKNVLYLLVRLSSYVSFHASLIELLSAVATSSYILACLERKTRNRSRSSSIIREFFSTWCV